MNKSKLKSYAPQARKDFIAMVQGRAAQLGLSESSGELQIEDCIVQGEVAIIGGQAFPAKVAQQRDNLIKRMRRDGFSHTVDAIAYTWFNRFAALRYMELHNYLGHGQRVLSSVTAGGLPDILTHALELVASGDLPGISSAEVAELKLASKDGELYKRLLVAQCNQLAGSMDFLFERIDDDSELLLPDNLLRTDSVVNKLVESIDEADWDQVEIIGWLYQFYISEKKDEVIGKVVKSEDIPAATQLFTPNWIVKYLVQNSVGRLWLQANPASTLGSQWAYYIQPTEQTPEVQSQLDALIQTRIAEDGDTLDPESITVLDPACGSGHILVEAYDVLKAIYLERGYRERDIPRLILQNNLFGLDIDDRAAQLAGFALLMKARADDRRLFSEPIQLNIRALQESHALDIATLADTVLNAAIQIEGSEAIPSGQLFGGAELSTQHSSGHTASDLLQLLKLFDQAKTFGSLLSVPADLAAKLPRLAELLDTVIAKGDALAQSYAVQIRRDYLQAAMILTKRYDAVVANPPYMGGKGMNAAVKDFAKAKFPDSKSDLFAMFIERGFEWCKLSGFNSMVTMQSWMFLSSYEAMRERLLTDRSIITMAHLGARAFSEISGEVVQTTAFVLLRHHALGFKPVFYRLVDGAGVEKGAALLMGKERFDQIAQDNFKKIPGSPIAFWVSEKVRALYFENPTLESRCAPKTGISTGANEKYILSWPEVDYLLIGFRQQRRSEKFRYYPHNKGGDFNRWYGNQIDVLKYSDRDISEMMGEAGFRHDNSKLYFEPSVSWTKITSSYFNARFYPSGFTFNSASCAIFPARIGFYLGYLNSNVFSYLTKAVSQTLNFTVGEIAKLPVIESHDSRYDDIVNELISITKKKWDEQERSWEFGIPPILSINKTNLSDAWSAYHEQNLAEMRRVQWLEQENNRLFIEAYDLRDELSPDVQNDQIAFPRADKEKDMQRLISYAIGCMMGRYSLDEPGLIYAHAGNVGFDTSRYVKFPADADGIVPMTDLPWFPDDATRRITEFLVAVWGEPTRDENLTWLAESLGQKADETPEDTIRRYLSTCFFKDHCQTYKKRPIYWLFSSGKHKAFEALVYLHRYNESTLARMRAEYVVPLTGKMAERIRLLEDDALKASSTARKKIDKDIDKLRKKLEELRQYDEKLRHYADQRITLDLDDGVKVNYGKFGDLLDGVKAITGGQEE